jgi:hypothetical protein
MDLGSIRVKQGGRIGANLGRCPMKYVVVLVSALLLHASTALAQEETDTVAEATTEGGSATEPAEPATKKRSVYYRKARGWLWIEGLIGVSAYDPDQFGSLSAAAIENAPRLKGPEYGFAVGTPFGGPFFLGFFYRQANYGQYKLLKTGLDMQGSIMIPYVHIILRGSIGFAKTFKGNPSLDLVRVDVRLDLHRLGHARGKPDRRQLGPQLDQRSAVRLDACLDLPVHRGSQGLGRGWPSVIATVPS